ncbi:MAG TPA: class I SAM-dependent methyltransferase [Candidatus Limnocylindrales bacterium]|nr:class I SAM-dependent methyltransferase [Candidatus Limnocylindrales bacterium]
MSSFDERAATWDTPDRQERAEAVAAAIRDAVPLSPGMRTIEIGAGTGLLGLALAGDVGELVLSDPSAGMLEVTRRKLADLGRPNVSALRFDLVADPPPSEPFDLAVSQLVLHHLEDTVGALRAIRDLLAPGGRIALADLATEDGSFHTEDAEGIHHQGFDPEALTAAAREAGFADVEARIGPSIERDGRDYPLVILLGRRP